MATENRATPRSLSGVFAAFVIGFAAGCFVSTYVAVKMRSHAGFFTMADLGEPDYTVTGQESDDHGVGQNPLGVNFSPS